MLILDNTTSLTEDEIKLMEKIKEKPHLIVVNKCDENSLKNENLSNAIYISAQNKGDVYRLEDEITKIVLKNIDISVDSIYLANSRQIEKLRKAIQSLMEAMNGIKQKVYIDFIDIYLRESYNYLGEIYGETATDSLLNELFSKFCLGK